MVRFHGPTPSARLPGRRTRETHAVPASFRCYNHSIPSSYIVAKNAQSDGNFILYGGEGADEIFLGYECYRDLNNKSSENKKTKDLSIIEIDNLTNPSDFIRLRAETDSAALKKKFSNDEIYKKNLPLNSSYKSLYSIAEKVRYECLGSKMLKGIAKNLKEN